MSAVNRSSVQFTRVNLKHPSQNVKLYLPTACLCCWCRKLKLLEHLICVVLLDLWMIHSQPNKWLPCSPHRALDAWSLCYAPRCWHVSSFELVPGMENLTIPGRPTAGCCAPPTHRFGRTLRLQNASHSKSFVGWQTMELTMEKEEMFIQLF